MAIVLNPNLEITWEKLPEDYKLPNEPVDNINQPLLAAALSESLEIAGQLPANAITPTNYGICATVNGKLVVKAPDWAYIPNITVGRQDIERSYTPQLQGDFPIIVMEFVSQTDGDEYSIKPTHPLGKWYYYEQILKVPNYVIFEPTSGDLELYQLDTTGRYKIQLVDDNSRYWIAPMNLFVGVWQGTRENRTGYWLRWWDNKGELLLWGSECAEQEKQRAEQERQRAEQEKQRAERLAAQLRAAGIEPEA